MICGIWPIVHNCLGYLDQHLVEFACLCVICVILPVLPGEPQDAELLTAVNILLLPAGGSPLIAANTFTQLLRK